MAYFIFPCTDCEINHHRVSATAVNRVLFSIAEHTAGLNGKVLWGYTAAIGLQLTPTANITV
ncbi:hypothetical protein GCM10009067_26040 [Haloarcula sebkhae]|uniref:Uncharacterized protein n=1 Tax=Haloarcula sebkhae TaxID=932660 RepID=A0A830EMD5_9EURY|nr:hypothetical protein GCM10009067_26040 [Haloarcula sebkhae]